MAKSLAGRATKKSFTSDYTEAEVLELWRLRKDEGEEARLRTIATEFRTLCRLDHEVRIPKTYKAISKEVRTPFVRDAHYRITSSLVARKPVIHIVPKDARRKEYNEAAAIGERWDTAQVERCNKELGTDIDFNTAAAIVRDGESVLKVVHRPDAWGNFPDGQSAEQQDLWKRGVDLPIAWRDVDRLNVVYEGGEWGDTWVIEYGEYSKPFLAGRYGMKKDINGRLVDPASYLEGKPRPEGTISSSTGRSVKHEFFTSKEWHVLIDGSWAPGFPKPNPYAPYLPYFRAPAYELESLLYSLMFLVPRLDELLTMKLNWSVLGAYPNPVIETVPNQLGAAALETPVGDPGDAGKQQKVVWAPGKAIELPYGKTIKFLVPPPVGKDLNDLIIIFEQLIAIAGVPSVMRGMANSGDAGYLYSQMASAATMQYKLAAQSLQRQREKAHEFTHWLVGNVVNQTVYVQGWSAVNASSGKPKKDARRDWIGMGPEDSKSPNVADVTKLGPVEVTYRTTLPTDEQARAMIAMQLTNAQRPLYDVRTALETLMQEEDPDAIMDAIWVQGALDEEPLRSQVIDNALRKAGYAPPAPEPPAANPLAGMVGADGQTPLGAAPSLGAAPGGGAPTMLPPGPTNLNPVPLAAQMVTGTPSVSGITRPLQPKYRPTAKQRGVPGASGGRTAGAYPGRPGGPNK